MLSISSVFGCLLRPDIVLFVLLGALAGTLVGALPGLSVTMATALLVSITYSWETDRALAMIMGVYVVGVFSGAISAILINIPGAPSSVVTTLDGYPLARRGEGYRALQYAALYSFVGTVVGVLALWAFAGPVSALALRFRPMDYFLLSLFALSTVGSLTAKRFEKGLTAACLGLLLSLVGTDPVVGTPRLTFGIRALQGGVNTVCALVGLFGFAEVLSVLSGDELSQKPPRVSCRGASAGELLRHLLPSLYYSAIGVLVGALPGAGGPVAAFLAYGRARARTKKPSAPFGEGAVEGIVASESANNAVIGGALIPMLTLAIPGDATTAVLLSVFTIHGLRPGPTFLATNADKFALLIGAALLAAVFLLLIGLFLCPHLSALVALPRRLMMPVVTVLCVVGAYACSSRLFDVAVMFLFGLLGWALRRHDYPAAPVILGLVLGGMMDRSFRQAVSLAMSEEHFLPALLGRPLTLLLLGLTLLSLLLAFLRRDRALTSGR